MARSPVPETPRVLCGRCRRPAMVCYCAALTSIDTVTRVVILQHPRERRMPIGTARMASLCLPQASLHVGVEWDESPELRAAISDPARPPILLYPGPGARDVLTDPPTGPVTLIVVDGTWSQTKNIVRDNPVLQTLPRYAFTPPAPTQYRIRREPRAEWVSTIEALMHVLGALEGDAGRFQALLEPFRAMVDAHLAAQAGCRRARARRQRPRSPFAARLPEAMRTRFEHVVCVVAESNAWPYSGDQAGLRHELVHWVARRLATGETFDAVVAPQRPLAPSTVERTGLSEKRMRGGLACAEALDAFGRFLRPGDVICSWGDYAPEVFEEAGGVLPRERIDLRATARRLSKEKAGRLEEYAARIAPGTAVAPLPEGRGGLRLGMLERIVGAWRAMASAGTPETPGG